MTTPAHMQRRTSARYRAEITGRRLSGYGGGDFRRCYFRCRQREILFLDGAFRSRQRADVEAMAMLLLPRRDRGRAGWSCSAAGRLPSSLPLGFSLALPALTAFSGAPPLPFRSSRRAADGRDDILSHYCFAGRSAAATRLAGALPREHTRRPASKYTLLIILSPRRRLVRE